MSGLLFFFSVGVCLYHKPEYLWSIPKLVRWMSMMRTSQQCAHKWMESLKESTWCSCAGQWPSISPPPLEGANKTRKAPVMLVATIENTPSICWVVLGEVKFLWEVTTESGVCPSQITSKMNVSCSHFPFLCGCDFSTNWWEMLSFPNSNTLLCCLFISTVGATEKRYHDFHCHSHALSGWDMKRGRRLYCLELDWVYSPTLTGLLEIPENSGGSWDGRVCSVRDKTHRELSFRTDSGIQVSSVGRWVFSAVSDLCTSLESRG